MTNIQVIKDDERLDGKKCTHKIRHFVPIFENGENLSLTWSGPTDTPECKSKDKNAIFLYISGKGWEGKILAKE